MTDAQRFRVRDSECELLESKLAAALSKIKALENEAQASKLEVCSVRNFWKSQMAWEAFWEFLFELYGIMVDPLCDEKISPRDAMDAIRRAASNAREAQKHGT